MEYLIKNNKEYNNKQIKDFYNILPSYKKDKIKKYKNKETKINSIIGEILLKDLLLKHNIIYNNLNFYLNYYGKPYLKNNNWYFNISHSFNYIITTISDKEIGIDIEKIRNTPLNVINYFATQNEKKYILANKKYIFERIFKIYTLKEAYFKMKGENLNNILKVEFKIWGNKVYCSDNSVNCGFINDIKGFIIAYCEKRN